MWPKRTQIIALSFVVGLGAGLYAKFIAKPTYTASYQLFFQEEGGGMSSAMRLASQFGFSLGGGSASSSATVQEFITSRTNVAHALNQEAGGKKLLEYFLEKPLSKDGEFAADFAAKYGTNQRFTDSLLTEVVLALNEEHLSIALDEETGTVSLTATTENELLSYELSKHLIANTENQFVDWKREKSQAAVDAFQEKVDSLELEIDKKLRVLGEYEDQNNALISSVDKMKRMRLTIDLEGLKVAYGEYLKGLEMSRAELLNLEPPFEYFDAPVYPLEKEVPSAAKNAVFGAVITGFLLVLWFIGRVEGRAIMEG